MAFLQCKAQSLHRFRVLALKVLVYFQVDFWKPETWGFKCAHWCQRFDTNTLAHEPCNWMSHISISPFAFNMRLLYGLVLAHVPVACVSYSRTHPMSKLLVFLFFYERKNNKQEYHELHGFYCWVLQKKLLYIASLERSCYNDLAHIEMALSLKQNQQDCAELGETWAGPTRVRPYLSKEPYLSGSVSFELF